MSNLLQTTNTTEDNQTQLQTTPAETLPTPQPTQPDPLYDGLEVQAAPSVADYMEEAKKVLDAQAAAGQQYMAQYTEDLGEDVARQVYGQNVGATSGVGRDVVQKAIQTATDRYAPYLADIQGRMAEKGLGYYESTIQRQQQLADERRQFEQTYGNVNPDTGQPWTSQQEADSWWSAKNYQTQTQAQTTAGYGVNPDTGKAFGSTMEAKTFWDNKLASDSFARNLVQQYGQNPETGAPFTSIQEAEKYGQAEQFQTTLNQQYGSKPDGTVFTSVAEAEEYTQKRTTRLNNLFNMAVSGQLQGNLLDEVLGEYGITKEDIDIPEAREQTIEAYINSKLANDQPINMDELNQILEVTGMDKLETDKFLYSPTFAKSILATDNTNLKQYLAQKGFSKTTKYKGDFLGVQYDGYWDFDESPANIAKFKKLYKNDKEFREYIDTFLS